MHCSKPKPRALLQPFHPLLLLGLALVVAACSTVPIPAPPPVGEGLPDHTDLDAFLARHVDEAGRVDYAAAVGDRADLDRYVAALARHSPDATPSAYPEEADRLAYWINAYNAWVIVMVLDAYPIASVRDVSNPLRLLHPLAGFFLLRKVTLGGERISLYSLENRVVRRRFSDPRIHFALNCASISCPRLPAEAFAPERLEAQLSREADRFLSEPRNVRVDAEAGEIHLSSIFDWYASDFTDQVERVAPGRSATLSAYLISNAPKEVAEQVARCEGCREVFVPYDWGLNDRPRQADLSRDRCPAHGRPSASSEGSGCTAEPPGLHRHSIAGQGVRSS